MLLSPKTLQHYGHVIADKNHETTEGNFIRITTYHYKDNDFVIVMFNGGPVSVSTLDEMREIMKGM